ncbi:dipeptide ABC transporter ATP-binding protein [Aurantimonas endophytica]|nr:dipeptide ABC transporter ATP-binding protein [Aurantimonas endophytica]
MGITSTPTGIRHERYRVLSSIAPAPAPGPLLSVENLSVAFHQGGKTNLAVDDVSFSIDRGETLALVGESGSGKSVSALSILKLLPYPSASHPGGAVMFDGENLIDDDEDDLRRVRGNRISMIFQEPMSSLNPLHTIERQVGEVLKVHRGMRDRAARERTLELMHQVGIRDPEKRLGAYPHQLSGGQRQRVMIAMALANEPDLLIADEPTTALDVTVQAQILELLKVQQQKRHMAMLFITHDLGIVRRIADRVCVMYRGKIVEHGPTARIFSDPQHDYTKHLLAAEPKGRPPAANANAPVVMEAKDLKVWFPIKTGFFRKTTDHVKAVDGVDIAVRAGQTVGVVGESGSGKTTLGLALCRMISSKGEISFDGERIDQRSFKAMKPLRERIQIVFQDPFGSLSPRMTIADIVAEGLGIHERSLDTDGRDARVVQALNEVGLDPATRFRYPHEFSGGQRQRVAIARAMVLNPRFVMLDEPTSALDMSVQAQVVDLLRDLQKRHNLAYLFISHDLKVVRALANEVIVMRNGLVVERGPADEIFDRPQTDYTKALMAAAFDLAAAPTGIVSE